MTKKQHLSKITKALKNTQVFLFVSMAQTERSTHYDNSRFSCLKRKGVQGVLLSVAQMEGASTPTLSVTTRGQSAYMSSVIGELNKRPSEPSRRLLAFVSYWTEKREY